MITKNLTAILRLDGLANLAGALALLAGGGLLTDPLGLDSLWPLWALAVVLAVNGVALLSAAEHPVAPTLLLLAVVDAVFAAAVFAFAAADPTGADTAARWVAAGIADATLLTATAKLLGRRAVLAHLQ